MVFHLFLTQEIKIVKDDTFVWKIYYYYFFNKKNLLYMHIHYSFAYIKLLKIDFRLTCWKFVPKVFYPNFLGNNSKKLTLTCFLFLLGNFFIQKNSLIWIWSFLLFVLFRMLLLSFWLIDKTSYARKILGTIQK